MQDSVETGTVFRQKLTYPEKHIMQKIFVNNSEILFKAQQPSCCKRSIHFSEIQSQSLDLFIHKFWDGEYGNQLTIWGSSPTEMLDFFAGNLQVIIAGGGLVQNPTNEVLFIFRRNLWDFPKGKPESNESIEETAIREVEEECGISGLTILSPLPTTYHIYSKPNGGYILKKCIWFHMRSSKWKKIKVQIEESITDARWIAMPFPEDILDGAFPSIKQLAEYFQQNYRLSVGLRS
jgi:8-oxo-dGTP pyrophosphatase MutT (NUDIX family)